MRIIRHGAVLAGLLFAAGPVQGGPDTVRTEAGMQAETAGTAATGRGGLSRAILDGADVPRITAMIRDGADVNAPDAQGQVPLIAAIARDNVEVATLLLEKGAKTGAATPDGMPALAAAAIVGHPDMVQLLLDHGAPVNVRPENGMTPLSIACMATREEVMPHFAATLSDRTEVVKMLLAHGADPDVRSPDGLTLLMHMAVDGPPQIVGALLENGAQANATGPKDITALMLAAENGNVETIKVLLRHGANPAMKNGDGKTAQDFANASGQQAAAALLKTNPHGAPRGGNKKGPGRQAPEPPSK
jgi:ankyrin repeat protein